MKVQEEIWKDIEGYDGKYQVSNFGRIVTFKRYSEGRILKQYFDRHNYLYVILTKNSIPKTIKCHRIVANAFILNPENKATVNHRDSNRSNNCVDNLEWATSSENSVHAIKFGKTNFCYGEKQWQSKLKKEQVLEIRALWEKGQTTQRSIAKMYDVHFSHVSDIIRRKRWKHI
jgi:predicted XRE-type DNA-binding protein